MNYRRVLSNKITLIFVDLYCLFNSTWVCSSMYTMCKVQHGRKSYNSNLNISIILFTKSHKKTASVNWTITCKNSNSQRKGGETQYSILPWFRLQNTYINWKWPLTASTTFLITSWSSIILKKIELEHIHHFNKTIPDPLLHFYTRVYKTIKA